MAWPVQLGRVEMSPFITGHVGRHRWGSVLGRYFINSKGVAITVHPNTPLHVSINAGRDNRLCLKVSERIFRNKSKPSLTVRVASSRVEKSLTNLKNGELNET